MFCRFVSSLLSFKRVLNRARELGACTPSLLPLQWPPIQPNFGLIFLPIEYTISILKELMLIHITQNVSNLTFSDADNFNTKKYQFMMKKAYKDIFWYLISPALCFLSCLLNVIFKFWQWRCIYPYFLFYVPREQTNKCAFPAKCLSLLSYKNIRAKKGPEGNIFLWFLTTRPFL